MTDQARTPDPAEIVEKFMRLANTHADTLDKEASRQWQITQSRWHPWQIVITAMAAGAALATAIIALTTFLHQ